MSVGRPQLVAGLALVLLAVAVALPHRALADAVAGGAISGHVNTSAGAVCVRALDPTGQAIATTASDDTGRYVLHAVPAGRWVVEFVPDDGCLGADTADGFQYYAGAATPATATRVRVRAGQTTRGIDATLAAGALVTGTVTDSSGNGLTGVCVLLEDTAGTPVVRQPTGSGGIYKIDQLPAGRFILRFVDDGCVGRARGFAATFLGGRTPATATVLYLQAGQTAGHLDQMLIPLQAGGGSGGSSCGTVPTKPVAGGGAPACRKTPPPAVLSLLGAVRGRFTVDRSHRLHLRVRCDSGGPICRVTLAVNRVRRRGTRLFAGSAAGWRSATIRPGRTLALRVLLSGVRSGPLWIALRGRERRVLLQTVISVRWRRGRGGR